MTMFLPEWTRVSGRSLQIRRVLNQLDDAYIVRMPIRLLEGAPNLFVQHPEQGWLAIAVHDAPFSSVNTAQLFQNEEHIAFEGFLKGFRDLHTIPEEINRKLGRIVLMWSCTADEASTLTRQYEGKFGFPFYSGREFLERGERLIPELLTPLCEEEAQTILGGFFPESEIPAEYTTQRHFHRDNSAKLARFFLDVQQEWASKLDLVPPREQAEIARDIWIRLVNGVAGSGKTLILLSRALMLAEKFPSQRVLLLIHNTPIVAVLKNQLRRSRGGVPPNLIIETFFGWAVGQWKEVFGDYPNIQKYVRAIERVIHRYRDRYPELKPTEVLLAGELDFINEAIIEGESQYLEANRSGRGFLLRSRERSQMWKLYAEVTSYFEKQGTYLWSAIPHRICIEGDPYRLAKYHHILIDEAQFFAPSWFQLVKLSSVSDGSLFVCADPNQGFLKRRLSWKSVGLDVTG
jgi:Schlafen group 3, DNA/RNA helicase domain